MQLSARTSGKGEPADSGEHGAPCRPGRETRLEKQLELSAQYDYDKVGARVIARGF